MKILETIICHFTLFAMLLSTVYFTGFTCFVAIKIVKHLLYKHRG